MKRVTIALATLVAALSGLSAGGVQAGDCCCNCGGGCGVRKVCRLVCETKKIKDYCYGCKCDEICLPGKSCRGCLHSGDVCASCGQCGCDCGCDHKPLCHLEWYDWKPGCADMLHIKKLVKYEVEREVCSFKWVVEEVCDGCCGGHCESACGHGHEGDEGGPMPVPADVEGSPSDEAPMPPMPPAPMASRRGQASPVNFSIE